MSDFHFPAGRRAGKSGLTFGLENRDHFGGLGHARKAGLTDAHLITLGGCFWNQEEAAERVCVGRGVSVTS